MRFLEKLAAPTILEQKKDEWLEAFLQNQKNDTCKFRYRHNDIKRQLKLETSGKCVYCESYIGHNTPGDTEHKIPTFADPTKHFDWTNLTYACTECNRRKNAYFHPENHFIDPYNDPVEDWLSHDGPVVFWTPPNPHMETCITLLKLNSDERPELMLRKTQKLQQAISLLERIEAEKDDMLRLVLGEELRTMCGPSGEYSMCVTAFVERKGFSEFLIPSVQPLVPVDS